MMFADKLMDVDLLIVGEGELNSIKLLPRIER